jgi:hypothetical protein
VPWVLWELRIPWLWVLWVHRNRSWVGPNTSLVHIRRLRLLYLRMLNEGLSLRITAIKPAIRQQQIEKRKIINSIEMINRSVSNEDIIIRNHIGYNVNVVQVNQKGVECR